MPDSPDLVFLETTEMFEKADTREVAEMCRLIAGFPDTTQISGSTPVYDFGFPNVELSEDG